MAALDLHDTTLLGVPLRERTLCLFSAAGRELAIDVALAEEAIEVERITPVPRTDPAMLGLTNRRGSPLVVLDLARLFAWSPVASRRGPWCCLVLRHPSLRAALAITRVRQVLVVDEDRLLPLAGDDRSTSGVRILRLEDGRTVRHLDGDDLFHRLRSCAEAIPA